MWTALFFLYTMKRRFPQFRVVRVYQDYQTYVLCVSFDFKVSSTANYSNYQCFRSPLVSFRIRIRIRIQNSESRPMRIRIRGFDNQKLEKKLQLTIFFMKKDVQATAGGKPSPLQKRTSRTSKHKTF